MLKLTFFIATVAQLLILSHAYAKDPLAPNFMYGIPMRGYRYYSEDELAKKNTVIVYYANELADVKENKEVRENFRYLTQKIKEHFPKSAEKAQDKAQPSAQSVIDKLEHDFNIFENHNERDIKLLKENICRLNTWKDVGLAVIRAGFYRATKLEPGPRAKFQWEYCKPPSSAIFHNDFELYDESNPFTQSQPLSARPAFLAALRSVFEIFEVENYRYVLIVRSYGTSSQALSQNVAVNVKDADESLDSQKREAFWSALASALHQKMNAPPFSASKKDDYSLLAEVNEILSKAFPKLLLQVSKTDFLRTLDELTFHRATKLSVPSAYFPIVVMDSPRSALEYDSFLSSHFVGQRYSDLPYRNVGLLFTTNQSAFCYKTINYDSFFSNLENRANSNFLYRFQLFLDSLYQKD